MLHQLQKQIEKVFGGCVQPLPAGAGHLAPRIGPGDPATLRPAAIQLADLPQHLTLPSQPFVLLAHHPTLDVLACRHVGFTGVALYAAGFDITNEAGVTVAEAAWLCSGPTDLVRQTIKEKFNVELS